MIVARTRSRAGLTLIELVVVLFVLAALAALIIPRLGYLQDQAKNAAGAAGSADLMNNLEVFRVSSGAYPQKFDSLLTGTGTVYTSLWSHPGFTPPISAGTLGSTADFYSLESFGHAFSNTAGNYYVEDQDPTATDPSSSGTILRQITFSGSDAVAIIAPPTYPAVDEGSSITDAIWAAAGYPQGVSTTGITLVAFGVGPNCGAVGQTLANAPRQVSQDSTTYARFIAVFVVYGQGSATPGKTAQLATVLDSYYQPVESNITSFKANAPTNNVTVPTP